MAEWHFVLFNNSLLKWLSKIVGILPIYSPSVNNSNSTLCPQHFRLAYYFKDSNSTVHEHNNSAVICVYRVNHIWSYRVWLWTPPASGSGSQWRASPLQMPKQPKAGTWAASWSLKAPSNNQMNHPADTTKKWNVSEPLLIANPAKEHTTLCFWPNNLSWFTSSKSKQMSHTLAV